MKNKRPLSIFMSSFFLSACASFGSDPEDSDKEIYSKSKQYDAKTGKFENRRPGLIKEMNDRAMSWDTMKEWLFGKNETTPAERLPEEKPDIERFLEPSDDIKVIWFGHSTFLLNIGGKIVLVDPVFSGAASPVSFLVKRFQDPVVALEDLPEIEYIVISHDHYDHLDMETVKYFADKNVKFLTPLGVGSHLNSWGIPRKNVIEKDWWQTEAFDGIEFVATPAQHFSGRTGLDSNRTLWASWVIKTEKHRVYFSGDSGYDVHFKDIGEKYGPFDIAFLETGQYNEKWRKVHMHPEEAVQAYNDLKAKRYFPVHWGMFELSTHAWYEPIERVSNYADRNEINLIAPRLGQMVVVNDDHPLEKWWEAVKRKTVTALKETVKAAKELYAEN